VGLFLEQLRALYMQGYTQVRVRNHKTQETMDLCVSVENGRLMIIAEKGTREHSYASILCYFHDE